MKNLFKALANFQQECPIILKDTQAFGYKYADLPAIFPVINPILKKNGLGFTQLINGMSIKTIIFHIESGEQLESSTDIPQGVQLKGMNDFQVLGSAITYIRRYALSSALGLVTDKDTDASGEQLKNESKKEVSKLPTLEFNTKQYNATYEKILVGDVTIDKVKQFYTLSKEVENALKSIK
jgi:hypothetical protein